MIHVIEKHYQNRSLRLKPTNIMRKPLLSVWVRVSVSAGAHHNNNNNDDDNNNNNNKYKI